MDSLLKSRIGESQVAAHFIAQGYDVYMPTFGNAKFDMIVSRDNEIKTVEVKSSDSVTDSGKYIFQLRKVRSNKTKNVITNFDSTGVDYLALYVIPTGRIDVRDASVYNGYGTLTVPG